MTAPQTTAPRRALWVWMLALTCLHLALEAVPGVRAAEVPPAALTLEQLTQHNRLPAQLCGGQPSGGPDDETHGDGERCWLCAFPLLGAPARPEPAAPRAARLEVPPRGYCPVLPAPTRAAAARAPPAEARGPQPLPLARLRAKIQP